MPVLLKDVHLKPVFLTELGLKFRLSEPLVFLHKNTYKELREQEYLHK